MCGICGFYKTKKAHGDIWGLITNAFINIQSRGQDASGMGYYNGVKNVNGFVKIGDNAESLIKNQSFTDVMKNKKNMTTAVFHTRHATHGKATENVNNHPFMLRDLLWIHNGIIWNYKELAEKYALPYSSECDSYIIGLLIDYYLGKKLSIVDAITKAVEELDGYFAIALLYNGKLYLVNGNGDLYINNDYNGYFIFASEKTNVFGNDVILSQHEKIVDSGTIITVSNNTIVYDKFKATKSFYGNWNSTAWDKTDYDYLSYAPINSKAKKDVDIIPDNMLMPECEICYKSIPTNDLLDAIAFEEKHGTLLCKKHRVKFIKRLKYENIKGRK